MPDAARVTFGYFNPTRNEEGAYGGGRFQQGDHKKTALRIYMKEKGEPEVQLACFTGIKGFRDETIKLTRIKERVVLEQNFQDDGEGEIAFSGKERRQLVAVQEPDQYH